MAEFLSQDEINALLDIVEEEEYCPNWYNETLVNIIKNAKISDNIIDGLKFVLEEDDFRTLTKYILDKEFENKSTHFTTRQTHSKIMELFQKDFKCISIGRSCDVQEIEHLVMITYRDSFAIYSISFSKEIEDFETISEMDTSKLASNIFDCYMSGIIILNKDINSFKYEQTLTSGIFTYKFGDKKKELKFCVKLLNKGN